MRVHAFLRFHAIQHQMLQAWILLDQRQWNG